MKSTRIVYDSDGLRVTGLWLEPSRTGPYPTILFNRGGRDRYGMLNVLTINNLLYPLVERGYRVLASNYRGVDGGEGEDEFGGAEVQDIVRLAQIAKQLPDHDGRLYMFGWSRGGMMTLLALKHGVTCNAIALGAPLVDLTLNASLPAEESEAWARRVIPNYDTHPRAALEARSATKWIERITVPTLLMHGDADRDVSIKHSETLKSALDAEHVECELVRYDGGNHYLNRQRDDVIARVDDWFRRNA